MRDSRDLVDLLAHAHAEERRFARELAPAERERTGTPEAPAPKELLAHIAGAKQGMRRALEQARRGEAPDPSHDRERLLATGRTRTFAEVDADLAHQTEALIAEVARLRAHDLASRPDWAEEPTLADEIAMRGVTHGLVHLYESLTAQGATAECVRIHEDLVVALPDATSGHLRGGVLYNLACLYCRDGRVDDARAALDEALRLQPTLADLVPVDADLAPLSR